MLDRLENCGLGIVPLHRSEQGSDAGQTREGLVMAPKSLTRTLAFAVLAGGLASTAAPPASAALIHDISITAGNRWQATGQISFDLETGNSVDDIAAFSLISGSIDFGLEDLLVELGDIVSISWAINPLDWSLLLDLVAEAPGGETVILSNDASIVRDCLQPDGTGVSDVTGSCLIVPGVVTLGFPAEDTRFAFTAVEPDMNIPEPATLALFGLGLAGLAGLRRRGARPSPHRRR